MGRLGYCNSATCAHTLSISPSSPHTGPSPYQLSVVRRRFLACLRISLPSLFLSFSFSFLAHLLLAAPNDFPCRLPRASPQVLVASSLLSPLYTTSQPAQDFASPIHIYFTRPRLLRHLSELPWPTNSNPGVISLLHPAAPLASMAIRANSSSTCRPRRSPPS